MKKDKSKKQAPAEFNNNPFKSLKSFKTQAGPAAPKQTPAKKKEQKENEDDAAALFLRAMSGTRSLHTEAGERGEVKKSAPPEPARADDEEQKRLFLQAMQKIGTSFRHADEAGEEEEPRLSPSGRMKQLKRGAIRIREELDLHGCLRDQALVKLEHFITSAYRRGFKAVLVITGKGINSPEGPVLQGAVADWLQRNGKAMVAEFGPAPRDKGGSGAYVVFLRSR